MNSESTPLIPQQHALVDDLIGTSTSSYNRKRLSWWDRLTFRWFTPILYRGNEQKRLNPEDLDLVPMPMDCKTRMVCQDFDRCWREELDRQHPGREPSLVRAMARAFGPDYARAALLKLVHDLCIFVGPQVLNRMIRFLRNPDAPVWHGVGLSLAITVSQLTMSLCLRQYFFKCYMTGLRIRTALVMAIYRKALVLSASERQVKSLGQITNLASIDAQRMQELASYLNALWSSPLQIALAMFFLWRQLGASALGGVMVIVVMIPVSKSIAQWMGTMQDRMMEARDKRVELNGEVLSNMKTIKLQAWEEPVQERILALREKELKQLSKCFVAQGFSEMLWNFTPLCVSLATFAAYTWTGHTLDVASALTALALLEILRFPLFMLPQIISDTVQAAVSLKRIYSFLRSEEHSPVGPGDLDGTGVKMETVSAAYDSKRPAADFDPADPTLKDLADKEWEVALLRSQLAEAERRIRELSGQQSSNPATERSEQETSSNLLCLRRIDFHVKPGELVAVVGGVGCGKTSFIKAILGELRVLAGSIAVRGNLSYFSQNPFIMNASVRDNILFGHINEPTDESRYRRAVESCALSHDLALLPNGDATEIGERGITLSGGQRARVALARAVYHQGAITVIDDALAAVDAHVARHLFENAILGELLSSESGPNPSRSVILVTNALQYLKHPRVDRIVVIQEGRVVEEGTYTGLSSQKESVFWRYLSVLEETGAAGGANHRHSSKQEAMASTSNHSEQDKSASEMGTIQTTKLMTEETREAGQVNLEVYWEWFKAAGGVMVPVAIFLAHVLVEGTSIFSNWWLTYWSAHGTAETQTRFLGFYALINSTAALLSLLSSLMLLLLSIKASRKLFTMLLAAVLHSPMSFFDTTPVGRLVNRFSEDIYTVDQEVINTMYMYLATLFAVISTIAVISGITPVFSLCLIPMILFYRSEQRFFTVTYRELKRLDSVSRSPIFALLGESIDGVDVIRAFKAQTTLTDRMIFMLDRQQHAYYLTCTAQSWLAVRLEMIGTLVITFACLSAVFEHFLFGANEKFAGLAGLSISYALSVTQSLNWSVRMASDMEASMVAVERIREYSRLENEGSRATPTDLTLPSDWPEKGEIVFENAKLRYRLGLPLVLKGLDIRIPPGSKVGVVGRTGAGKSTLMVALMRVVELSEGRILIDGQDTRLVGLAKLRKNIAVIPQDPVLFSGTVRSNLDPFNEFEDDELYAALESVGLCKAAGVGSSVHSASSLALSRIESLDDAVSESGTNFSAGQRQLMVIARALLRGAKVVIMDEATAAVDAETDASIQKVMRGEFADATCLTVAHRLNTITNSDYILVMHDGHAAEFDTPEALMKKGGMFSELVRASSRN